MLVRNERHIATRVVDTFIKWYQVFLTPAMVCLCPVCDSANYSSKKAFKLPWQQKKTPKVDDSTSSNPGQIGLTTLVEPTLSHSSSSTSPLNIVFVHGLGGSAEGTWIDSQTNSFWPLWLSKVKGLENARIMTFGYDSSWNKMWKSNNVLDISDFAKQLVHDLWCHYLDYGDVIFALPLYEILLTDQAQTVFVAHSMGGLVVKKVLLSSLIVTKH